MNRAIALLTPSLLLLLFCQSTKPMLQTKKRAVRMYDQQDSLTIQHCFFEGIMMKHHIYDPYGERTTRRIITPLKECTFFFDPQEENKHHIELRLPTSPNRIEFGIKEQDYVKNHIHYGDTIVIKDDIKSVALFNETTQTFICRFPKENTFFHIGKKTEGDQPKKAVSIYNVNLPLITITKTAYQRPLQGKYSSDIIKKSKLLMSLSGVIRVGESKKINLYSTEDDSSIIDSILILDIAHALQKIKIRASCDAIKNGDVLSVMLNSLGLIIVFRGTEELAQINTAGIIGKLLVD